MFRFIKFWIFSLISYFDRLDFLYISFYILLLTYTNIIKAQYLVKSIFSAYIIKSVFNCHLIVCFLVQCFLIFLVEFLYGYWDCFLIRSDTSLSLVHCPLSILFSRWPNHKIVSYIPTHPKCVLFMIFRSKHERTDLFLKQIERFLEPLSWSVPLVVCCAPPIIDGIYGLWHRLPSHCPSVHCNKSPLTGCLVHYKTFGLSVTYAFWLWCDGPEDPLIPQ